MKDAAKSGPVSLDSGTPYAGCKDDTTSVVTPAYEISMSKMVTAADCPAGSTFVATSSADAVWAASANTGVYCDGNTASGCVMKYHAYTGLPIWATTMDEVDAVVPMPDGTLHAIGDDREGAKFGSVSMPDSVTDWVWHAVLNGTTGAGLSVQTFGDRSSNHGMTRTYDATATPGGDLVITGYTQATSIYFDDAFTVTYPEENKERNLFLFKVATSAPKVAPSCITSTSTCEIDANSCYIDGLCYADGDRVPEFSVDYEDGNLCRKCNVTQSQTSWSEDPTIVGVSECFIDGACYKGNYSGAVAEWLTFEASGSTPVASVCQYCDPAKDKNAWSVVDGYTVFPGKNPPDDCRRERTSSAASEESDGAVSVITYRFAAALASLVAILLR